MVHMTMELLVEVPVNGTFNDTFNVSTTPVFDTVWEISAISARWQKSSHHLLTVSDLDIDMIEDNLPFFTFYGVILPILTILGSLGNIICFFVFHHPEMRCLSTMFISAILVCDTFYLIGATIILSPRSWLSNQRYDPDDHTFWTILDLSQRLFIGMYPLTEMAQCLVVWYTLALTIEQYFVFYHPERLWRYSTRDKGLQIITTIFIPTILVHLVHFFKFVRHDHFFHGVDHSHKMLCLSDIYRSKHFQIYEKFLYYLFFRALPWGAILLILPKIIYGGFQHRVKLVNRIQDMKLERVVKSGRSSRITILIIIVFFICSSVSNAMYAMAVKEMKFDQFMAGCHLSPSTGTFDKLPVKTEFLYTLFLVLYSCHKFALCVLCSYDIRRMVVMCFCWPKTNSDKLKEIMIYILSNKSDKYDD